MFDPVDQIEPSVRLVYTIEVETLRPGLAEFRASLTTSQQHAGNDDRTDDDRGAVTIR